MKTFIQVFGIAVWDSIPTFAKLYFTLLIVLGLFSGVAESHLAREKANAVKTRVIEFYKEKTQAATPTAIKS